MAIVTLAMIRPQDYPAFLNLAGHDFPDIHGTWLYEHVKKANQHQGAGWTVIKQDVFPDEFSQYCKRTNSAPTQANLDELAREKHEQQQQREKDKPTEIK
jgi:hypothetical protein